MVGDFKRYGHAPTHLRGVDCVADTRPFVLTNRAESSGGKRGSGNLVPARANDSRPLPPRFVHIALGRRGSRLDKRDRCSQSSSQGIVNRRIVISLAAVAFLAGAATFLAQELPSLINVVDFSRLLPLLPNPPQGWTADKAEGSTTDAGGFKLTNVHRDYRKGEGEKASTTSISILDSAANPDYVETTTAGWNFTTSSTDGYSKAVTVESNQGFETFENDGKHGTLWLMVAKRYFVQIETKDQDSTALQEWAKRMDLKKLAEVK
jgi:hypothetical protein